MIQAVISQQSNIVNLVYRDKYLPDESWLAMQVGLEQVLEEHVRYIQK